MWIGPLVTVYRLIPGHIDDHPATLQLHELGNSPATLDCSSQVHVYQFVEFLPVRQSGAAASQDIRTGIINPDIDSAEPGGDLVEQAGDSVRVGNIRLDGYCLSGKTLYFADYVLCLTF